MVATDPDCKPMSSLTRPTRRLPALEDHHVFLVAGEVLNDDLVTGHFFLAVVESLRTAKKYGLPRLRIAALHPVPLPCQATPCRSLSPL